MSIAGLDRSGAVKINSFLVLSKKKRFYQILGRRDRKWVWKRIRIEAEPYSRTLNIEEVKLSRLSSVVGI